MPSGPCGEDPSALGSLRSHTMEQWDNSFRRRRHRRRSWPSSGSSFFYSGPHFLHQAITGRPQNKPNAATRGGGFFSGSTRLSGTNGLGYQYCSNLIRSGSSRSVSVECPCPGRVDYDDNGTEICGRRAVFGMQRTIRDDSDRKWFRQGTSYRMTRMSSSE